MFTVAGTVAQWYFEPTPVASGSGPKARVRGPTRVGTSLRHALTSSLGSLCFSSAVLTLVQYVRQVRIME